VGGGVSAGCAGAGVDGTGVSSGAGGGDADSVDGGCGVVSLVAVSLLWYIRAARHNPAATAANQNGHRNPAVTRKLIVIPAPINPIGITMFDVPFNGRLMPTRL